jgi:hypothetical protein
VLRREVLLRLVASLHDRAQEPGDPVRAIGARQELRPRARDEVALDVAGGVAQDMSVVRADLQGARPDRLPDEKGRDIAPASCAF